jgi:DNA-binding transcriptional MerR regulator
MTSPPASDPGSHLLSSSARLSEPSVDVLSLAKASERLIQRFGGIRPMANKLEVPVTTVQGWKKRGAIPATRLNDLRLAAQRHGIPLEEAELEAVSRSDDRHPLTQPPETATPESLAPESLADPLTDQETAFPEPTALEPDDGTLEPYVSSEPPYSLEPLPTLVTDAPAPFEVPLPPPADPVMPASLSGPAPVPPAAVAAAAARLAAAPPLTNPLSGSASHRQAARLSMAAAVVALVAAGVAIWSPAPAPVPTVSAPAVPAVAERRLGDLESKVTRVALEQGAQTAAIEKQISALDIRLAQTASRQTSEDLSQRITALEQELPALQRRVAAQGTGSPALAVLLAATQLRGVLTTANPFVNELAAFRLTGFVDPPLKQALDQIASRAVPGIETEAWLIGRFSVVQGNILRAASLGNPIARVGDLMLDTLSDWMPPLYRLTGVSEGPAARAIADRAQALMATGEFGRAVDQLSELTGLPSEVAAPWLAEARARVIADRARSLLAHHMLAIAQPGATLK